jgi:thiamine transport system ATP-binding protein
LEGTAAARILTAAGLRAAHGVALRRSALSVSVDGPITGEVVSVRATPEQVRLVCRTDFGEVDAVASLDDRPAPGDPVHLGVDPSRLAPLGTGAAPVAAPLD